MIGGCFDPEFAEESNLLIQQIKLGKYCAMISDMRLKELEGAPQQIRDLVKNLPIEHLIEATVAPESIDLAEKYISEKVVPPWCQVDALHIATATFHNADLLLSWNFKHIVNVNRIMRYNSINLREGYKWL